MKKQLLIIVAVAVFMVAQSGLYVVKEGEQVLITQFGKPVSVTSEAGLKFKLPMAQDIHRFQKRILKWDGDPNQIPTKDKKYIWVDTTARWKIADPLKFFTTVATENGAQSRLDDIIDSVVRDAVSGHLLVELVRGSEYRTSDGEPETFNVEGQVIKQSELTGREEIIAEILEKARANTPDYGIDLIDVQIKRINYVEQVRRRVYERMISERKKVAAQYRSEGEGEKADILGQMQKELKRIESGAYRTSVEIRGKADAEAAAIYAAAYNKDPKFYALTRTLEAYRKSLKGNSRLVLSTNSEFYRYLRSSK